MKTLLLLGYLAAVNVGQVVAQCTDGDVRLQEETEDSSSVSGVAQLCTSGVWRTACLNTTVKWNTQTANLACRQLGHRDEGSMSWARCSPGAGQYVQDIACSMNDALLRDCEYVEKNDCPGDGCLPNYSKHAALQCLRANCTAGEVRLVGGSSDREGRVEVCVDGRWGTVCNNNQEGIARAVCSQLGFTAEVTLLVNSFSTGHMPVSSCTVDEGGSLNCSLITDASCDHSMDLGVVCRTYKQAYNELLDQRSSTISETTSRDSTATGGVTTIITALGVVSGVLVVLLLGTLTALVVTCIHHKRGQVDGSTKNISNLANVSPSVHHSYEDVSKLAENPAYKVFKHDQKGISNYEDINH